VVKRSFATYHWKMEGAKAARKIRDQRLNLAGMVANTIEKMIREENLSHCFTVQRHEQAHRLGERDVSYCIKIYDDYSGTRIVEVLIGLIEEAAILIQYDDAPSGQYAPTQDGAAELILNITEKIRQRSHTK